MKKVYEVNYECAKNVTLTQAIARVRASVWSQLKDQADDITLWMTGVNQGMNVLCQLSLLTLT